MLIRSHPGTSGLLLPLRLESKGNRILSPYSHLFLFIRFLDLDLSSFGAGTFHAIVSSFCLKCGPQWLELLKSVLLCTEQIAHMPSLVSLFVAHMPSLN